MGDNALSTNALDPAEDAKNSPPLTEEAIVSGYLGIAMVLDFNGQPKAVSPKGRDLRDALLAGGIRSV